MEETNLLDLVSNSSVDWSRVVDKIRGGFLSRLNFAEQRPYNIADFKRHFDQSLAALKSALTICESVEPESVVSNADVLKHFVVSLLLLCAENSQKSDWSKMEHIQLSYRILNTLKNRIFSVDCIHLILFNWSDSDQIFRWCLEDLKPKLVEKRWKEYPGAQQSLVWILNQVANHSNACPIFSKLYYLIWHAHWHSQSG
jgi:hypothetical protein